MIYSTATVPVNPDGEAPLTRTQAWAGLVLKARDARQFLPPGSAVGATSWRKVPPTSCARPPSGCRPARDHRLRARGQGDLLPGHRPAGRGHRQRAVRGRGGRAAASVLLLPRPAREGTGRSEEQAEQAQFDGSKGYKAALLSTLKRTRELLAEGAL